MTPILTRRRALAGYASLLTAHCVSAQKLIGEPQGRIAPATELLNAAEFEAMAARRLDSVTFAQVAGSERGALERITLRPRLMVDTTKLDLTTTLFGETLFAPILAGPVAEQKRFHPEGELAMARGASEAKAAMVVSCRSSCSIDQVVAQAKTPVWYQVWLDPAIDGVRAQVEKAVGSGCKALCVAVGSAPDSSAAQATAGVDWAALDRLRKGVSVPVVLKGVMSPEEAQRAIAAGVQGIVVSNYSGRAISGVVSPIEMLPAIAGAVAGRVPILIDGSFRLGSDVMKALALGAQAVLLGRPVVWGLAAYGDNGVQKVIELIQSGLARDMAMCGKINIRALDPTAVRIHRR
jgi:4-hydroxymandelate oxidase